MFTFALQIVIKKIDFMKRIFTLLFLGASFALSAQNLLTNGSFEDWTDGKPDAWFGSKTNIAASKIAESSDAQDGAKSLVLINDTSTHKRFTSQSMNLTADTSYTLTYYIKGEGDVRNGFFNGNPDSTGQGFSAYSPYTTANGEWQMVTYSFETGADVTDMEIIFSVRNTSAEGVLIDNAVLVEGGEIEVIEVATIADLRAGSTTSGAVYRLTGDALLTYTIENRNQKYIQDNTGGILIDDVAGRLGNDYSIGDKIANITGTLTLYSGLLQFVPTEEGQAASSSGNPVEYQIVSVSEYLANPTTYESKYIAFSGMTISDVEGGDGTFQNGKGYQMTDGTNTVEGRTQFFNIPLIGQNIPSSAIGVIGFGGRFNDTLQLFLTEVTEGLGVSDLTISEVAMTSVWNGQAHFFTKGNATVEIYNLNGQLVQKANGHDTFTVNVSALTKGVYVVKVTVNGQTTTHKAVKK